MTPATADNITPQQIAELRARFIKRKRKTSYHRATLNDIEGALKGSRACLEFVASAWNKSFLETP